MPFFTKKSYASVILCYRGRRVHCSLWANYAERMTAFLATHDADSPVVVVMQQCKTKKYCGTMGVSNAFYGTKLIIDHSIAVVNEYKSK